VNRHDRHTLKAMAAVVGVMIVAAIAGGVWVFNTPQGAHWGFEKLGGILPGKLEIAEMNGLLRGPMEIHKVVYRTDIAEVTIDTLKIDWRLGELWRRRLEVRALYAANVRWLVGKPGEQKSAVDSLASPLPDVDLPVAILIHKGEIHHLQITSAARDTGLLIDQVNLDASSLKDGFHVKSLVVHSHPIELEFDGTVVPRGSYPLTLSGRWAYRPPRGPRLAGVGSVTGTLDTLRVIQELSSPFAGHLDAFLYRPRDRMQMRANVQFTRLDPRELDPAWPAGTFSGWAHVEGEPDRYRGRGSIAGLSEMTGPARADFELGQDHGTWSLERVRMTLPRANTVVEGHGTVALDSVATRFDLSTQWTNLSWPLEGAPLAQSAHGSARLEGSTRDFGLKVEAALAGPQMPPGHWTLDGRGGDGRLAIRTIIADLLDGRITGSGAVAWVPRTSWRLRFDGKRINPGSAWPAWRGQLAFAGTSQGEMSAHGPNGRVLISRLEGTLRNAPIAGAGTLSARDGQYTLTKAGLTWGPNHADASGGFGHQWSLQWSLTAPALASVIPNANGSLSGKGTVQGPAARPHVVATMRGDSLFFGRLHAGTLRIDGDVDLAPHGVVRLDAAATQIEAGGRSAQRLLLTARGTRDQHEIRTSVVGRLDSLVAVLAGAWNEREWRGQVRALDLLHHVNGTWKLEAPAPLVAGAGKVQLTNLRWASGSSRVELSADWQHFGPWHLDSELQQMQLALLTPWMPEEMRFTGPLAGHLRAHGDAAGHVWCDADLTPGPGEVTYLGASGKWIPTRFEHAKIEAKGGGVGIDASARADLVGVGTVRATLALPSYGAAISADRQPLRGTLSLHVKDLALAQGFSHELDATGGQLDTDLHFGGTVGHPDVWGPLHVKNAVASIPRLGIDAKAIDIQGTGSQAGQLTLKGSLQSGPGTLTFDGTAPSRWPSSPPRASACRR